MKSELHSKLQDRAIDYMLAKSYWIKAKEIPTPAGIIDVWGLSRVLDFTTMAIEVKVSRNDFRSYSQKRKEQTINYRGTFHFANSCYILCPAELIKPEEIDENWGLLWYEKGKKLINKKQPRFVEMTDRQKLEVLIRFLHSGINNPPNLSEVKSQSKNPLISQEVK